MHAAAMQGIQQQMAGRGPQQGKQGAAGEMRVCACVCECHEHKHFVFALYTCAHAGSAVATSGCVLRTQPVNVCCVLMICYTCAHAGSAAKGGTAGALPKSGRAVAVATSGSHPVGTRQGMLTPQQQQQQLYAGMGEGGRTRVAGVCVCARSGSLLCVEHQHVSLAHAHTLFLCNTEYTGAGVKRQDMGSGAAGAGMRQVVPRGWVFVF